MGLLTPLALALAGLSIPILIFYMLKLRRDEQTISSTMLWQQVLQDREANSPWQKLRRNLLLLLQLLLLALLVLALARPYSEIEKVFQGHVIVLLDASASMQATDVAPNRFEVARSRVHQIIDSLGPNDTMTLIAVANMPRVLASLTNDKSVLRQALAPDSAAAQVSNTEADWSAAFILAASSARQSSENIIVILSDGGLTSTAADQPLPALPGRVNYVPVGVGGENLAVAALAIRESAAGPQAYLRVANHSERPAAPLVEIWVNGALFDARVLNLEAHGESGLSLTHLPLDTRQIEVHLPDDALPLDNRAWAVRSLSQRATAMLISPGNAFLERALALMPQLDLISVRVTDTTTLSMPPTPPTLVVLDGVSPSGFQIANANLWLINPPASNDWIQVSGSITQTQIVQVQTQSPLLRYLDAAALREQVHIARARAVSAPTWAQTLIEAAGGPLLLAGEMGGRRVAVLTFDLHQSDLPLQIAFPILVANLTHWLAPTGDIDAANEQLVLSPGMPVQVRPQMGVESLSITTPSGQRYAFQPADGQPIPFAQTNEPGLYTVEQARSGETLRSAFAVNLFSELESAIAPQSAIEVNRQPLGGQTHSETGRREWWRWPALAALGVLLLEWFAYWRNRMPRRAPHSQTGRM